MKKKNHYIFQPRADGMPGALREGQLICTFTLSKQASSEP